MEEHEARARGWVGGFLNKRSEGTAFVRVRGGWKGVCVGGVPDATLKATTAAAQHRPPRTAV